MSDYWSVLISIRTLPFLPPLWRTCSVLLIICGGLWSASPVDALEKQAPPNLIFILTDDQGFGDASCQNPECRFQTPNIDRLASEGISFRNAHSSDTVCTPSRYGLLTGRYCWRTRLKRGVLGADGPCLIDEERLTLPKLLRNTGYATAMVGKWHLGMTFPGTFGKRDWTIPVTNMPLDKGFDYFYGIPASMNYGVLAWYEGRTPITPPSLFTGKKPNDLYVDFRYKPPYEKTPEEVTGVQDKNPIEIAPDFIDNQALTRFTDKSIAWMKQHVQQNPEQPFFLYLPYTSPHYPVCPLPEYQGKGQCGGYGEFLIETDDHIGRLLATLEKLGVDQNTIIMFSSDNGPESSWRQRLEVYQHASSGPFRGGKRDIYEGGHRVPFFVRWPAGIAQPGRTSETLMGQVDVLATMADLLQINLPDSAGEDSISFLPALKDPQAVLNRKPMVNHAANGRYSLTEGTWKVIAPHRKNQFELYDLGTDPAETRDVSAEHPDMVRELTEKLTEIVASGRTTAGKPQPNDTGFWQDLTWMTPERYSKDVQHGKESLTE
ncbi:MAG: arylsulfatase [Planctomycetaceae bacterium]|nr:arylsulfatase [Planctomycetaceae bacterium]